MNKLKYIPSGDSAFIVKFGEIISPEILSQIRLFVEILKKSKIVGVLECVPAYCDVTVHYNPLQVSYQVLIGEFKEIEASISEEFGKVSEGKLVRIPVCYGGDFALDIEDVASQTGLKSEEIIQKHSGVEYLVYMLGFTPGFCYLGGMNEVLNTPRKTNPRQKIFAGAVGIAGSQTGIYPIESPGGWQIIGRTPLKLFNPVSTSPFLLEAGNRLEFYSISKQEYKKLNEHEN